MLINDALSTDRPLRNESQGPPRTSDSSRVQQEDSTWRKSLDRSLDRADRRDSQKSAKADRQDQNVQREQPERSAAPTQEADRASRSESPEANAPSRTENKIDDSPDQHGTAEAPPPAVPHDGETAGRNTTSPLADSDVAATQLLDLAGNGEGLQSDDSQPPNGLRQLLDNVQSSRPAEVTVPQSASREATGDAGKQPPLPSLMQALHSGAQQSAQTQNTPANTGDAGTVIVDALRGSNLSQDSGVPATEPVPALATQVGNGASAAPAEPVDIDQPPLTPLQTESPIATQSGAPGSDRSTGKAVEVPPSAQAATTGVATRQIPQTNTGPETATQNRGESQTTSPGPQTGNAFRPDYGMPTSQQVTANSQSGSAQNDILQGSDADPVPIDTTESTPVPGSRADAAGENQGGISQRSGISSAVKSASGEVTGRADTPPLTDQLAQGITTATRERGPLRIRLNPPELGTLEIEVTTRNGGVTARLNVQSPGAHKAILDNLSQLQDALTQQGHTINRIDVQLQPDSAENGQQSRDQDDGSSGRHQQDQSHSDTSEHHQQQQSDDDLENGNPESSSPATRESPRMDQLDIAL